MTLLPEPHTAYIYDRGGTRRVMNLGNFDSLMWSRQRDEMSQAKVVLTCKVEDERTSLIGRLASGRHELVIYRGERRVWEGPITLLGYEGMTVTIEAKDVCFYLYRTVIRGTYDTSGAGATTVLLRLASIFAAELARKEALVPPANVLPHVTFVHNLGDSRTARKTEARQTTLYEELDSAAHRAGVDYVTVGRGITLWDTHRSIGQTPQVTAADFDGKVIVTEYGMDLATEVTVTDGQGNFAVTGGLDPFYGWNEVLFTAYDESEGVDPPSVAEMLSQAQRNISGRNPSPIEVRIPDGSTVNPRTVLTIDHLIPGLRVPLRATVGGRQVAQMQKIDKVVVTQNAAGETITMTLSPAALLDEEEV